MFIRETKTHNKKTGKVYVKHTLVESFRSPTGPRQRTIMQLGEIPLPKEDWPALASELERRISGQPGSGLPGFQAAAVSVAADLAMRGFGTRARLKADNVESERDACFASVNLKTATSGESRSIGAELAVDAAWKALGMPSILKELGFSAADRSMAEAVVAARLIAPGSDLAAWRWMREASAIGEVTEERLADAGRNQVYKATDRLLARKDLLEKHLRDKESKLFPAVDQRLFLFDLTNFYMEGQCLGNSFAQHGKSKEKRSDCRLVSLAMAVDGRGFPIFSKVYPGNIGEPATLEQVLREAGVIGGEPLLEFARTAVVMDRGIATDANLALLSEHGLDHICIERGARDRRHLDIFAGAEADPEFTVVEREGGHTIRIRKMPADADGRVEVLCVSSARRGKEEAMLARWEERASADLVRLCESVGKGNIKSRDKITRKIGRLEERYAGLSRRFGWELADDTGKPGDVLSMSFSRKALVEDSPEGGNPLLGAYVISTTLGGLDAGEIWSLYMTQTRVEAAFKSLKSDLGTRPIHHQNAERTEAHLFVSVLAYHLLNFIEQRLREAGDTRKWSTIRTALATHQRNTLILVDAEKAIHHIRQTGAPEAAHLDIYGKIGADWRMRRSHEIVAKSL